MFFEQYAIKEQQQLQILCFEILAGICLIPDGHQKILCALTEAVDLLGERTRFQKIVDDLHRFYRSERETQRVRTAAMSLINALLSTGPAEATFFFFVHLTFFFGFVLPSVSVKLQHKFPFDKMLF